MRDSTTVARRLAETNVAHQQRLTVCLNKLGRAADAKKVLRRLALAKNELKGAGG